MTLGRVINSRKRQRNRLFISIFTDIYKKVFERNVETLETAMNTGASNKYWGS